MFHIAECHPMPDAITVTEPASHDRQTDYRKDVARVTKGSITRLSGVASESASRGNTVFPTGWAQSAVEGEGCNNDPLKFLPDLYLATS
ncbi:hypothetical protein AVEN_161832-1 [Araneus ventricosus]|uniref:Uncharacterized protein n=1 Tax=Araneus ventricosus TaxID=182803 RepID=A0A4Y2JRG0_ARAVE|nr:hypothetical protein AVEN_161832-1 [Araneus ventricosus]